MYLSIENRQKKDSGVRPSMRRSDRDRAVEGRQKGKRKMYGRKEGRGSPCMCDSDLIKRGTQGGRGKEAGMAGER